MDSDRHGTPAPHPTRFTTRLCWLAIFLCHSHFKCVLFVADALAVQTAEFVREWIDCHDTSIGERLREHSEAALEKYLAPVAPGLEGSAPGPTAPAPPTVAGGVHPRPVTYLWEARSRRRRRRSSGR